MYYGKTRLLNVNANERKLHFVIYAWLFTWNGGICDEMGSSFNRMYRSTCHWFLLLLRLSGYLSGQEGYDNSPDLWKCVACEVINMIGDRMTPGCYHLMKTVDKLDFIWIWYHCRATYTMSELPVFCSSLLAQSVSIWDVVLWCRSQKIHFKSCDILKGDNHADYSYTECTNVKQNALHLWHENFKNSILKFSLLIHSCTYASIEMFGLI